MTSMNIPEPVMSLAIMPKTREASGSFSKALSRFQKEDPTFKVGARHILGDPVCKVACCSFISLSVSQA